MNVDKIISQVRKLAKSHEYQSIYSGSKEFGFRLFKNNRDFSTAQIKFLGYLNFYATICMDIYLKEVDSMVLEKEIYEDAYMYYKQNKSKEDTKEEDKQKYEPTNNKMNNQIKRVTSKWQFRGRT